MSLDSLIAVTRTARAALAAYRGGLRRLRPVTLDQHADEALAQQAADVPGLRLLLRNPQERIKARAEVRNDLARPRARAAAGQRSMASKAVAEAVAAGRAFIAEHRADVEATMPTAYHGVTADGMIALELYRLQLVAALRAAPAAELLGTYRRALNGKRAADAVACEVVERLAETRQPLAVSATDRAAAKALREHIDGVRDLRVPSNVPDVEALAADLVRLHERAELLAVHPADPAQYPDVAEALAAEAAAMVEAGSADDAEDQAALRELMAGGARR
ncbi:MAG: hypothetical protein IT180_04715 [Acidobacteria bacterium]|nr:hypothetical protein [Acidobacteriota bacterium]